MSFFELTKRGGRVLALSAGIAAAASLGLAPGVAQARHDGGGHGGWQGGGGWHGGGHWGHRGGWGIGLGLLGGAVAGAAIANSYPYYGYYGYPYDYYYGGGYGPYYPYGYGY